MAKDGEEKGYNMDPIWKARTRVSTTGIRGPVAGASREQEAWDEVPFEATGVLRGRGK